jgi:hypothetical protein
MICCLYNLSDQTNYNQGSTVNKKRDSLNHAAQQLKRVLQWPQQKDKRPEKLRKSIDQGLVASSKIYAVVQRKLQPHFVGDFQMLHRFLTIRGYFMPGVISPVLRPREC